MSDENITILILNSVKKIRGLKINKKRIRLAIISAVAIFTILVASLASNYFLFKEYRTANQRVAFLESQSNTQIVSRPEQQDNTPSSNDNSAGRNSQLGNPTTEPTGNGSSPSSDLARDIFADDRESDQLRIEILEHEVRMNDLELSVRLTLAKTPNNEFISGYIVVAAKTSDTNSPFITWPSVSVDQTGTPLNYFQGESFSMRMRVQKEGNMLLNDPASQYEYFSVFVYSTDGEILLKKTTELSEN